MLLTVGGLVIPLHEPVIAGRDERIFRRLGNLISRELLDDKLIVGFVCVKGIDDVVAVAPDVRLGVVPLEAVRLRIAHEVEPVARPFFAILRPRQQVIYGGTVGRFGITCRGGHKGSDRFGRRWQTDDIVIESADEDLG